MGLWIRPIHGPAHETDDSIGDELPLKVLVLLIRSKRSGGGST